MSWTRHIRRPVLRQGPTQERASARRRRASGHPAHGVRVTAPAPAAGEAHREATAAQEEARQTAMRALAEPRQTATGARAEPRQTATGARAEARQMTTRALAEPRQMTLATRGEAPGPREGQVRLAPPESPPRHAQTPQTSRASPIRPNSEEFVTSLPFLPVIGV